MRRLACWTAALTGLLAPAWAQTSIVVDATRSDGEVKELGFPAGGKASDGRTLAVNNRYLILDGTPWLPVMGEMHYSRYPDRYWEEEILKMKAGGVTIVSSYVFWIHHEEIEGRFDWSGQRSLRRFVELCGRHGMFV